MSNPTTSQPSPTQGRRPLLRLFVVLLTELVGFGIAIPILPFLAAEFDADGFDVGLLFAVQAAGQFVLAPTWGSLSDRFGRKAILVVTLLAAALGSLATALAPSLILLFAARIFAGAAAGNITTATAYITDVTDDQSRSRGMAVIGICFGLGFTLGPAIGAGLASLGYDTVFYITAGISAANALMAAVLLIEPLSAEQRAAMAKHARGLVAGMKRLRAVWHRPAARTMFVVFFLYSVAITMLEALFAYYMKDIFGYEAREVGMVLAAMALVMVAVQGGAVGRLSKRLGDPLMSKIGLTLLAVGLVLSTIWIDVIWFVAVLLISSVGRALAHPGMLAVTSRAGTAEDTGRVMGILQSFGSLGRIFGPALGGAAYIALDERSPFILAGALVFVTVIYWVTRRRQSARTRES